MTNDKNMQAKLALFNFFGEKSNNTSSLHKQLIHSNTISIYDALPKYNWAGRQPKEPKIVRRCTLDRVDYEATIEPAHLELVDPKTKEKKWVSVYPGVREEAVEDVLRFLAANGQGEVLGKEMGVHFTLNEVVKELKNVGKTYSNAEVVEALTVCNKANLKIDMNAGEVVVNSPIFPHVTLVNRKNYVNTPSTRCFVRFHPMVIAAIVNVDYRMFNYQLAMSMKNPLARHIFKRISHYWRQASQLHTYNFNLMSYLAQTPRNISPRMHRNIEAMNTALDELIENEVLEGYENQEILEGRSVKDVSYVCKPHAEFVKGVKKANYIDGRRNLYSVLPELPKSLR